MERDAAVRDEQGRGGVLAGTKIAPQELEEIGLEGIDARVGALEPLDGDTPALEVKVVSLKQANLGGSQSVAVGSQKDGSIAQLLDDRKEAARFVLGEKTYGLPSELVIGLFGGHGGIQQNSCTVKFIARETL